MRPRRNSARATTRTLSDDRVELGLAEGSRIRREQQSRKIDGLGGHDSARFVFGADLAATAVTKRPLHYKIPACADAC